MGSMICRQMQGEPPCKSKVVPIVSKIVYFTHISALTWVSLNPLNCSTYSGETNF